MDLSKIIDKGIVIVLLIFVFVVYGAITIEDRNERSSKNSIEQLTRDFTDTVRSKGYIDPRDYIVYQEQLGLTGGVVDVVLEHYKKRYEPLYGNPNDFYSFTGSYEVAYDGYYTEHILQRLFPNNGVPEDHYSRRYNMRVGDLFEVRVSAKELGISARLRSIIIDTPVVGYAFNYGGMIRSEAP